MPPFEVVLDTNVIVAALRSRLGASFRLLSLLNRRERFRIHLSVPLVLEYEEVLTRQADELGLRREDIDAVLDYLCSVAELHEIFYLWRPMLRDPEDELVLELAVAGRCEAIVTHNRRDFAGAEQFGIGVETPGQFLMRIGDAR